MSIQATLIATNGERALVILPLDDADRLRKLQEFVGGFIEVVPLPGDQYMVISETGKLEAHAINHVATKIAHEAESIPFDDYIAGVAVVVPKGCLQ